MAPIPSADFAKYNDQLKLVGELGIVSLGHVGSVLLFGDRPPDHMRDIAFPTDSSTSKRLLRWYLGEQGLDLDASTWDRTSSLCSSNATAPSSSGTAHYGLHQSTLLGATRPRG